MGGSYSGGGILRHQAILRIDSKRRSRMDINFRIRLAFPKAFSADHYFKKIPYPIISENFFHNSQTIGRSQGQPKALFLQLPKDIRRLLPEYFRKIHRRIGDNHLLFVFRQKLLPCHSIVHGFRHNPPASLGGTPHGCV